LEAPLSTRYCPDHPGVQIARVGEHLWQCELDKKSYNFETGFELNNGSKVPGGDVAQQTQGLNLPYHAIFDTREGRLGQKNAANNATPFEKIAQSADDNDARRIVQLKSEKDLAKPEDEVQIPEMLGTEEEFKGEDPQWEFLKELLNSPEWKSADQEVKQVLLRDLQKKLQTL